MGLVSPDFLPHYSHLDPKTIQVIPFCVCVCVFFVSNSPRKTASKRSLLLTPVLHGLSRGPRCQKPSTPLKVKSSHCLGNLQSPPSFTLSGLSHSCPCLHEIAFQPHLPPPTSRLPSLPHALAGLFARSQNKRHTTGKAGCPHIEIVF